MQVLEGVIKYRWNALPVEQRDGMKNYISEVIVQVATSESCGFERKRASLIFFLILNFSLYLFYDCTIFDLLNSFQVTRPLFEWKGCM